MYFSKPRGSCHVSQFGRCRPNLSFHRSSNPPKRRVHRTASAVASADHGIINRLIGRHLLQLDHNRSVVPLLQPVEHQLPFAAALLVHHATSSAPPPSADSNHSHVSDTHQHTASLVELSYVLSGSGHFTSKSGETQLVSAGDSILAVLGEISFAAGSPDGSLSTDAAVARSAAIADVSSNSNSIQQPASTHWKDSITWLKQHTTTPQLQDPHHHHQHQHQHQQQQQQQKHLDAHHAAATVAAADSHMGQQQQLVMLQLLLPSELLTGELDHHHLYHLQEVEQQSPWAHAVQQQQQQQGSQLSSVIDQRSVCELLSGAFRPFGLPEPQQQQQQQQQDLALSWSGSSSTGSSSSSSSSHQAAASGSSALTDNGNGFNHSNHSSSSSRNNPQSVSGGAISSIGTSSSSLPTRSNHTSNGTTTSSGSSSLPALSDQARSCVKRTLAEVGAFQLPAQTNRVALLFGPHASPAVSLSFGVEVFEPGHVTPLHIHNNAHELFFVLAGKGVGVHGPGSGKVEEQLDLQQQQQQQDTGRSQHADQQQQQQRDRSSGGGVQRVEMSAGDVAVFPPGVLHGLDNPTEQQLYCLQMMLPNDSFVEWVRSGQTTGALDVASLQQLAAAASCGAQ